MQKREENFDESSKKQDPTVYDIHKLDDEFNFFENNPLPRELWDIIFSYFNLKDI